MELQGMKDETTEALKNVNREMVLAMQRLSLRITNVEVYIAELAEASADVDELTKFLRDTKERALSLRVKIGSNGQSDDKAEEIEETAAEDKV